jgi:hypothetical protein
MEHDMSDAVTSESSTIDASADWQSKATELETKLAAADKALAESREALDAAERKRDIERELSRQGAIDLESATLLTEAAVAGMDKADAKAAIADLKRSKPFLFKAPVRVSAMSGAVESESSLDAAAAVARESGDRRALLRYLRMRRGG